MKQNEAKISESFAKLVYDVCKALTLVEQSLNMQLFHVYLTQLFKSDIPQSLQTIVGYFEYIAKKCLWSYSHYSPLESIAKEFAEAETRPYLEVYKKQLAGFYSTTKLLDYIDACQDAEEADPDTPLQTELFDRTFRRKLTVKLQRRVTDETLQYVDDLWRALAEFFLLPSLTALLERVVDGSIIISWWISDSFADHIRENSTGFQADSFYSAHQIDNILIDNESLYIYNPSDIKV